MRTVSVVFVVLWLPVGTINGVATSADAPVKGAATGRSNAVAQFPVKPDITVAGDGSGDFKTIQAALDSIPPDNRQRMILFIKDGVYHEKVKIDPHFITLRGQSRAGTRIEFGQGADEFTAKPDNLGRAVVNINGDDCVLENLTVKNTHGVIGPHAFAIYGRGDRTVIVDSDVLSQGADTIALWGQTNGSYQARLKVCGSVDFLCPRGWCYMTDCIIQQVNPKAEAAIWHDGSKDKDMKFVLRNCRFDGGPGVNSWILSRRHHDAQFYLLDCTFSKTMSNLPPHRVIYPINGAKPTEADIARNKSLDPSNIWGERAFYYNCHKEGGDYAWFADNLSSAPGAPRPEQITAVWTFAGNWDPERTTGPRIQSIGLSQRSHFARFEMTFDENVTVKGKPRLALAGGGIADYASGTGSNVLVFTAPDAQQGRVAKIDLQGGAIIATEAAANLRVADVTLP